ncbi:NAD(P)-binding protein [Gonapodya prolifera JEL478]|uniref:NAD(P)-binding protein n=1 Tax=Gonapodya prolifera (strain JEL478) TaxID=1344416 RepID=A0A138ZWN1_GONPJ|nr:NAD(P)-binding protein [Gonapodya prolifera JEL478]|eukprot:KXS08881.1 NAD(P)-binding protein [Gonapodya prolifera JEL478]
MYDVRGKVVIITGAGSGFGERLAVRLAPKGAKLVLSDLNAEAGNRVTDSLKSKFGPVAFFVQCDVSDNKQLKNLFVKTKERFGTIDVVINNAGIPETTDFFTDELDRWQRQLDINLKAVILGTRLAIDSFTKDGKGGVIVSTASLAGLYPQGQSPVYGPVKAAVVHFCRSLSALNAHGIRVNAVCPSYSPTGIQKVGREDSGPSEITKSIIGVGRDATVAPQVHPEQVIDAFVHAIEDETIYGQAIRITPERGIEVQYHGRKPPLKLKDLTDVAKL